MSLNKNEYVAPKTKLEKAICRGFEVALDICGVGATDDFIQLGGDESISQKVIDSCVQYDIAIEDILTGKTPRNIAKLVENKTAKLFTGLPTGNSKSQLTASQMGIYLECMLNPQSTMYNIPFRIEIKTKDNLSNDEIALKINSIIERHPTLYSRIEEVDGAVYMIRCTYPKDGLVKVHDTKVTDDEIDNIAKELIKPFDMKNGPLCNVNVYKNNGKLNILINMHHAIADGTSVKILYRQIVDIFGDNSFEIENETIDAFALDIVEKRVVESQKHEDALKYFDTLLDGVEIDSDLTPDFSAENNTTLHSKRYDVHFDAQPIVEKLTGTGITKGTLFMGAFGYTIAKMTGQEESMFMAGESGRKSELLDNTISMMVKTLPIVCRIDENKCGKELLLALQNQFYQSIKHDNVSLSELTSKYSISGNNDFVYQADMYSAYSSGNANATMSFYETGDAFTKINTSVIKNGDEFILRIEYRTDLYKKETIERFAKLYLTAVDFLLSDVPMKEMPLVSSEDKALLNKFNDTNYDYDDTKTFIDLFNDSVKKYPDKTAVVFRDKKYTYREVDEISDRLAGYIHNKGIGKEQTVSIIIPRGEYMAIASIGVMKAGAIYEPMDPSYPSDRLDYMLKDADAKLVIADRELIKLLPNYTGDVLYIDEISALPSVSPDEVKKWAPSLEDTYILLYTSGTTGNPKGCMICQKNLVAFIMAHTQTLEIDNSAKITLYPSYGFDAHMGDLYPALSNGCTIYIIPEEMRLDFPTLKAYIEDNEISHAFMTTQVARQFLIEYKEVKNLKFLSMGGESLLSFEPNTNYKVLNLYGPTEATVCVTRYTVNSYVNPIPIGHPIENVHIYIADAFGRNVPIGVPGELIICGPQVAKGYLNKPEKTADVFVKNIYEVGADSDHQNCYKTGDFARYTDDGDIVFIGRRDLQVKIRGFRIELSEIEQVIRSYDKIKDTTVVVRDGKSGKCIHAYIVSDEKIDIPSLVNFIKSKKPQYMVPAGIMQIDKIPLTVNQKVDKRKLPPIEVAKAESSQQTERALTIIEEKLIDILKGIIGDVDIDITAEFSDLGITSITSIQLASKIYKQFGLHTTSKELLNGGNILNVENAIIESLLNKDAKEEEKDSTLSSSYPLTQTQMGIYLDSMRAGIDAYNIPLMYKLPNTISIDKLKDAIKSAVKNHPSMLAYIYADVNGNVAYYPALDMPFEIDEVELQELKPKLTNFEFSKKPLFHFSIITCKNEKYLLMEVHHIISDGESMGILQNDIDKAYRGEELQKEEMTAYELSTNEQSMRNSTELATAKSAYDSIFKGVSNDYVPCKDLDLDTKYALLNYPIKIAHTTIREFCNKYGVTENILFTSVFALTISKYTFHDDALFATIYNGRIDPRTERLVSMLVKTLPIYVQAEPKTTIQDFLKNTEKVLNVVKTNDLFSFADAVKEYGVNADVMFIYQSHIMSSIQLDGNDITPIPVDFESPKADISVELFEKDVDFELTVEYNAGHYSNVWMEGFADAYATCLNSLLTAQTISDVNITSEKALKKFDHFNDTDIEVEYKPAYKRIVEQSLAHPDKIAIIASPEDENLFKDANGNRIYEKLTYACLDNMTNYLANVILQLGIKPGDAVGVMTGRSKEVYIGEFGILKAGCPFIFLSPQYPKDRIKYICDEASIKAIVTTHKIISSHEDTFNTLNIPIIYADDIDKNVISSCPNIEKEPDSLAYMIYTSGSTGQPKGVMITQKGINNLADMNEKNLQIKHLIADVMCAVTSFTFDASVLDGYVSIANGATLCIASDTDVHNPIEFCDFCIDNGVQAFTCTPSFAISLLDCPKIANVVKQLKAICCGGEVYPPMLYEKLKSINPNINLINGYGPSETTISCSARLITSKNIDIGTPINNTKIYIIDKQNRILPMGALGELVITGIGVGLGYLNRPDLTEKSFITLDGVPAYKSGDLALITNNENVEFHGRIDNQVKLRGLRVELGEIENAINSFSGVKNSIVVVKGKNNNQYLVAYYTADTSIPPEEIKAEISKTLTEYMVPRIFIELDEMPMTANGKIDKKALPEPLFEDVKHEYVAPSNKTEEDLCKSFENALGLPKVGVTDDFFELGGTSLTATKIAMFAIANNIHIAYKDVFTHPTVRQLAIIANNALNENENADEVDISNIDNVLSKNVWHFDDDTGYRDIGNVLLTGATGFLGIHVLKNLLNNETGDIYCLLKKGSFETVEAKLNCIFFYYFETPLDGIKSKRIHCIEGDITDKELVLSLSKYNFDTVINCAACVKHFAKGNVLENVNVKGVENLVKLCQKTDRRIIHVSTVSVAGEGKNGTPDRNMKMTEDMLYFNQILENQYILSKFKAEKIVLNAISQGLDGKIMRAGNLMPRFSDGEFQLNYQTNGFMRQLRGYHALGCAPYSVLSMEVEFSPIDDTASAIIMLAKTDKRFSVFHTYNTHKIFMSDILKAMNEVGLKVECVLETEFAKRLEIAMQSTDQSDEVGGLIAYLNRDNTENRYMLGYDNSFTANVLNRLGHHWNIIDDAYLVGAFKNLNGLGFFVDKD